jgi:hypothetical protein
MTLSGGSDDGYIPGVPRWRDFKVSANKINDILRGKAYIHSSYFITVLIIQEA